MIKVTIPENSKAFKEWEERQKEETMQLNNMNDAYREVCRLELKARTLRGPLQTLDNITLKIMEELGELATDLLKLRKFKVTNELASDIRKNMKEEAVDGLIMYMTLCDELQMDEDELMDIFEKKLKKWEKNHLNPNDQ